MSFGAKITVFVVLLAAVLLASLSATVLQLEYRHLTSESRQQAVGRLRAFIQVSDGIDWSKSHRWPSRLARVASESYKDPNIVYLVLQDRGGALLYHSQSSADVNALVQRTTLPPKALKALTRIGFYDRPGFMLGDEPVIELMAMTAAGHVARLGLREGEARVAVERFAKETASRLLLINACAVAAAFLAAFLFARSLESPLRAARRRILSVLGRGGASSEGLLQDDLSMLAKEVEAIHGLVESLQAKPSQLVGTMSHEFRSPLQAILGYTGLLRQGAAGPVSKKGQQYLAAIEESALRFKSFTDSALDLVRLDQGPLEVARAPFDLAPIAKGVGRLFAPEARFGSLTIRVRTAPHVWVEGDADRTYHALMNLVSNAVKFTPEEGEIEVSARQEDGFVRVTVADTGRGIAPEEAGRVFEKFYQAAQGARPLRGAKGVGIGLTLAKAVVEAQGGRIWLESEPGRGTRVHFTLPRVRGKARP